MKRKLDDLPRSSFAAPPEVDPGRRVPMDDARVREKVRKAFMSIRGMRIDDVFPPSRRHDEIHY
ncbi:MAG TPA: hypothetical protein VFJ16_07270 [Longimicrobium sp.]|nr:hypothetical protein [Longimicrobium sp.]